MLGGVDCACAIGVRANSVWFTDAEKGKYFKILAAHAAPAGRYSKQEVKRRKEDEEVGFWFSTSFSIF